MESLIERYVIEIKPINRVVFKDTETDDEIFAITFAEFDDAEKCEKSLVTLRDKFNEMYTKTISLSYNLDVIETLLRSYQKTVKHDAKLLADATTNGYLPPLDGWKDVSIDG